MWPQMGLPDASAGYTLVWNGPVLDGVSGRYSLSGRHRGNLILAALAFMEQRS